jgi:ppGpp synthetase/RelA/SpoT-type nucleotidyltranferase
MRVQLPQYSRSQVNKAARWIANLAHSEEEYSDAQFEAAFNKVWDWRACYPFPVQAFYDGLNNMNKRTGREGLVVLRLKRFRSIINKLRRKPHMALSQMQDIGGCRVVYRDLPTTLRAMMDFHERKTVHELVDIDDYISRPQSDGYRGAHFIYKYKNKRFPELTDLRIEVQFRSFPQHTWATAVEIVDTFTHQDLKSKQGRHDWTRFFVLASGMIAMAEGAGRGPALPNVPGVPENPEDLREEFIKVEKDLKVIPLLKRINVIARDLDKGRMRNAYFFLIKLDVKHNRVAVETFAEEQNMEAAQAYYSAEQETDINAVIVTSKSLSELKQAYPNYFGTTNLFVGMLQAFIGQERTE